MNVDTKTLINQPPLPTRALWSALLTIHGHLLVEKLGRFRVAKDEIGYPQNVVDAIRLLDCWLDAAIENGWLAGEEQED